MFRPHHIKAFHVQLIVSTIHTHAIRLKCISFHFTVELRRTVNIMKNLKWTPTYSVKKNCKRCRIKSAILAYIPICIHILSVFSPMGGNDIDIETAHMCRCSSSYMILLKSDFWGWTECFPFENWCFCLFCAFSNTLRTFNKKIKKIHLQNTKSWKCLHLNFKSFKWGQDIKRRRKNKKIFELRNMFSLRNYGIAHMDDI